MNSQMREPSVVAAPLTQTEVEALVAIRDEQFYKEQPLRWTSEAFADRVHASRDKVGQILRDLNRRGLVVLRDDQVQLTLQGLACL